MVNKLKSYGVNFLKNTGSVLAATVVGVLLGFLIVGVYLRNPVSAEALGYRADRLVRKLVEAVRKFLEK